MTNLRVFLGGQGKCEVFLGGSCNPTTWRIDVAIPLLQRMGITFYNPVSFETCDRIIVSIHYLISKWIIGDQSYWSLNSKQKNWLASSSSSWIIKPGAYPL